MVLRTGRRLVRYAGPTCPHCEAPLDVEALGSGIARCGRCRRRFEHERFTPADHSAAVSPAAVSGTRPETAGCGRHEGNAAETNCTRCGIFMCGLCTTPIDGHLLCPACFNRLAREDGLASLRTRFADYGSRTRSYAAAGFLFCMPLGWALGGLALYYGAQALRQPRDSVSGRSGIILAMILGFLELVFSVMVLTAGLWS